MIAVIDDLLGDRLGVRRRSNGVSVTPAVKRSIDRGNRARAGGEWSAAADAYRAALDRAPALLHVWIQLGHALKESGRFDPARDAYLAAAALASPGDPEPSLHLGHLSRRMGRQAQAAAHFMTALRRDPRNPEIAIEVLRSASRDHPDDRTILAEAVALLGFEGFEAERALDESPVATRIAVDISDLIAYFGRARLPTGIQRVQIEIGLALLSSDRAQDVDLCCYIAARHGWVRLDKRRFRTLAQLSLADDDISDPEWRDAILACYFSLVSHPDLAFPRGGTLLNIGTSWSERNYLLHVRNAVSRYGIGYVPLVFDLIPMIEPGWFADDLVRDYRAWIDSILSVSGGYVAISETTKADLIRIADELGTAIPDDHVRVVPLNGDFRRTERQALPLERLATWQLHAGGYVLMVSTIEPRKNHLGALHAWLWLAKSIGRRLTPRLVCVGGKGWMNDAVHGMLRRNRFLRKRVMLLSGISDAELDLLYRGCLATLYPSLYEGWGLPVTESLCYGKVPAISSVSALPEAGGRFAAYFDPLRPETIGETLRPLIERPQEREAREADIVAHFAPRPWSEIADAMFDDVAAIAARAARATHRARPACPGIFYSLAAEPAASDDAAEIRSGEAFRHGSGWELPGQRGCDIGTGPACLRLSGPAPRGTVNILVAAAKGAAGYAVRGSAGDPIRGLLSPGESRWLSVAIDDQAAIVEIAFTAVDARGSDPLTVVGFTLPRDADDPIADPTGTPISGAAAASCR